LWFLRQMQRWGWIGPEVALHPLAQAIYRPALLAPALAAEGILAPQALPALEEDIVLPAEQSPR
jgi:hypothetical protein